MGQSVPALRQGEDEDAELVLDPWWGNDEAITTSVPVLEGLGDDDALSPVPGPAFRLNAFKVGATISSTPVPILVVLLNFGTPPGS